MLESEITDIKSKIQNKKEKKSKLCQKSTKSLSLFIKHARYVRNQPTSSTTNVALYAAIANRK